MLVSDLVESAKKENAVGVLVLLSYFIHEKKLLELDSDISKLNFYLDDKFKARVNADVLVYKEKLKERRKRNG
jgi:hypothetical protein